MPIKITGSCEWDAICIGNAVIDMLRVVSDEELSQFNLSPGTMVLIDQKTAQKLYHSIQYGKMLPGGSAANTASGIASFGGKVKFLGKVKNDLFGKVFYNSLLKANINFVGKIESSGLGTGRSYILISQNNKERTMCTYLGAASQLCMDDVDNTKIANCKILFVEGYLWDQEKTKKAAMQAIDIARQNGVKIAFTLSDQFCVARHQSDFHNFIFNKIDIIFGNKKEAQALFNTSDFAEVTSIAQEKCKIAVFTLGAEGSVIISKDEICRIQPGNIANIVDTTGAGDLYAAGVLFGLSRGIPLPECGRLGNIASLENMTHLGARPKISLKQFL